MKTKKWILEKKWIFWFYLDFFKWHIHNLIVSWPIRALANQRAVQSEIELKIILFLGLVPSYDYEFGTDDYDITDRKPTNFGNALDMYMSETGEPDIYELLDLDKSDLMKNVFQQYFYY